MIISLLGTLTLRFTDIEGRDQSIKVQLPDYVLANYIHEEGKQRTALISGNMVLLDEKNGLKAVILVNGLVKVSSLFTTSYEPNTSGEKLIEGTIYKTTNSKYLKRPIEELSQLAPDVDYELATVQGTAIDKPTIQNVSYANWARVDFADPIPAELAMPSDIRFREDLIALKNEGGKGKIAKCKLTKKQKEKEK